MGIIAGVGYEGRSVDDVVETVSRAGVGVVVDVRLNAISRKAGLSKRRLDGYLAEAGIRYVHMPALGNPKDNRDGFRKGDSAARSRYDEILSNGSSSAVDELIELASSEVVALLCYERDASQCHRSAVTDELLRRQPSIEVIDL